MGLDVLLADQGWQSGLTDQLGGLRSGAAKNKVFPHPLQELGQVFKGVDASGIYSIHIPEPKSHDSPQIIGILCD